MGDLKGETQKGVGRLEVAEATSSLQEGFETPDATADFQGLLALPRSGSPTFSKFTFWVGVNF